MADHPLNVADSRVLLFDNAYTAFQQGFTLRQQLPARDLEPVLRPDRPWEMGGITGCSGVTVLADQGRYRMWYCVGDPRPFNDQTQLSYTAAEIADLDEKMRADLLRKGRILFCYAESRDGLHWEKPDCGVFDYDGSTANNIVACGIAGTVFIDPVAAPEQRYKMIGGYGPRLPQVYRTGPQADKPRYLFRANYGATSPDGLHWTITAEPIMEWYCDTANVGYWDRRIGKYVAFVRINQNLGFMDRQTVIMERGAEHYRCVGRSESSDFFHFPPPVKVAEPAPEIRWPRETGTDFYNSSAVQHPENPAAYFLFSGNFHHEQDVLEVSLSTSRDGIDYKRWPEPILGPGITGAWDDQSAYMATGMLLRDSETWMYYHGRNWPHAAAMPMGCGGIGRVRFRRDGFVAQQADNQGGELITHPLLFTGNHLQVNFDAGAGGRLQVEIQDAAGNPLSGFTAADADQQFYNDTARTITWGGNADLGAFAGRALRLRFLARAAKLYSFRFVQA